MHAFQMPIHPIVPVAPLLPPVHPITPLPIDASWQTKALEAAIAAEDLPLTETINFKE
jgi:hypothetical protein